jgi:hypothetical protein
MRKQLLSLFAAFAMAATVSAQVTFTCTAGKNFGQGEGIDKLFDGNTGTKYCQNAGSDCYALVTASEPVYVWGYDMTTANDNETYGRLVKKWTLYGTNDETVAADPSATGWVTLSNLGSNTFVQKKNYYKQRFFCDKGTAGTAYKYFKLTLDEGGFIQMSEFSFCYSTYAIIDYNWLESSNDNSKKAFDGKPDPKWEGGNLAGNWMTIETADQKAHSVKKYSFTTNDDGSWPNRAPKEWRLEGSNDNTNWTIIDEVTGGDPIANENYKTFEFTPSNLTGEFRYVRLTLISMKGTGWTQIGEFHVVADESTIADYYTDLVNQALNNLFDPGTMSPTDIWWVEYNNITTNLNATLEAAISSGNYSTLQSNLDKMEVLVPLMTQIKNGADVALIDGTLCWGDGHYSQLLDRNENTKWGGNYSGNVGSPEHVQYVIFRLKESLKPYFYKLITGNDTKTNQGRNWKTWTVYGANFTSAIDATPNNAGWVELDKRVDISEQYLPMENFYPAMFDFNQGVSEPYYYFMVKVFEAHSGTQIQMSEMYLCTEEEFEAMRKPLVDYFDDFDTTRAIEAEMADELESFQSKLAALKTTSDAVQLTLLYNECVALRTALEASMNYIELIAQANVVDNFVQIDSASDLVLFAKCVNGGKNYLKAALVDDIQLTATEMPAPIGNLSNPFKGTFKGQGHAIKGFTFSNTEENNVGLFGMTNAATIQDVMLKGANIKGNANSGGLVGNAQNYSLIQNCAVIDSYVEGRDHVATIVAHAQDSTVIKNNFSNSEVVSRQYQAGGMVGTILLAVVEKNLFTGKVTCKNSGMASGLVSRIDGVVTPAPIVRNNLVAATEVNGGETYTLIKADWTDRPVTFADNYIWDGTSYSTGDKMVNNKDDRNGMQISLSEATSPDFYYELGWDMTNDWKYVARLVFPVLAYMDAVVPTEAITVTDAGYATYFTGAELDFGAVDGVEAFVPQVVGNNWVHLEPITYVPANIGIVVKAAAGTYNIPYSRITAKDVPSDLKAAPAGFTANGNQYILAKDNGVVAFYKAEGAITEGKGYVEITDGSGVKALFFEDDDATAIQTIDNGQLTTVGAIFNLAGQRMSKMQKGINIVNGKKVLK